jgi:hypothetical protein
MIVPLNIKVIEKRKIFYDVGPYGFKFIPPIVIGLIITYLGLHGYNYSIVYITVIFIYFISYYFLFGKMYGWWLINYTVIGKLEITEDSISIKKDNFSKTYKIKDLQKIQLKLNNYQNYSKMRDIIYDGIGTIIIDNGEKKLPVLFFLIESKEQYEIFNEIKSNWKNNGLSIWT